MKLVCADTREQAVGAEVLELVDAIKGYTSRCPARGEHVMAKNITLTLDPTSEADKDMVARIEAREQIVALRERAKNAVPDEADDEDAGE